jgi:hypothetical protein
VYDSLIGISLAAVVPDGSQASRLVRTGRAIGSVSCQRLTPGATFLLRVGEGQWIPISAPFSFWGFDPLTVGSQGLFFRNDTAQAGATFDLVIGFMSDRDVAAAQLSR